MNAAPWSRGAMAVAFLALLAAVAGTAFAGPSVLRALSKSQVTKIAKKQAVKQVKALAPGLADDRIDARASSLSVASAADAQKLGNQPPSAYASSTLEARHLIGAPGEPVFQNGWANLGGGTRPAGFYKDPFGIVHLEGSLTNTTDTTTAFTLPESYRPSQQLLIGIGGAGPATASLEIFPSGTVEPSCAGAGTCVPGIDGVTFRVP